MRRLGFLLRPGWLALGVVVVAFTYLAFTVLAPWQLGKNTETSRENSQIAHSLTADPVPVTTLLPDQDSAAPDARWRRVTATGHYLADKQVLVRMRVIDGQPAFEVLAPFVVDGGPTVLVNRGFVRPQQGSQVPPIPPPPAETVSVTARLRNPEGVAPGKEPLVGDGFPQVYTIDTGQVSDLTGVPLTGTYLQLVDDQPGGLGVLNLPQLDAGPFLSYGIQWIAFGIFAPIALGYFAYAELRARRRERDAAATPPQTVEEKLADRYGRRR
ncbi:SURF1 family cytochrome oxidase biogenesis protein [Mycolicibacillus trivialis]|uniref:SURF1-like protein n=1 Tax=Mycolicibacillus trivialis TaxID=1798 RepID=A0A1X2EIT2_9MYCO|nr:SURF1 family protein [Mycolicibacillus trivialis]ORX03393.1 hypothetical protein AWC30_10915 [Mycolicibacillus trivialis]